MKTNNFFQSTKNNIAASLILISLVAAIPAKSQPDYTFTSPVLLSGTDKQVGATYVFHNVKPGVDAQVKITDAKGGATLNTIDRTIDGYQEAFQPEVIVPGKSDGYMEFKITFVKTLTNSSLSQAKVYATGLDIDGDNQGSKKLYEYDQIDMNGGFYDFNTLGGQLTISQNNNLFTAKNAVGVVYNGVDTSNHNAMFTVTNTNVTSFTFRAGVDNQISTAQTRYASLYFKKFIYQNSILAVAALENFRGNKDNTDKVNLQWTIDAQNTLKSVIVEKSTNGNEFSQLAEFWMNTEAASASNFKYNDNATEAAVYYRLKMVSVNGEVEYSNILSFKSATTANQFKVYPTAIASNATVSITSEKQNTGSFQVVDYSGRVVYQQQVNLSNGTNNITVEGFSNLPVGNYVAVLRTTENIYSQKVIRK